MFDWTAQLKSDAFDLLPSHDMTAGVYRAVRFDRSMA